MDSADRSNTQPALSCVSAQNLSRLFPPHDPQWEAQDVIQAIEKVRRNLRVPFFIYDAADIGVSLDAELAKMDGCGILSQRGLFYSGEYWFLKAASTHPWRVRNASEADILVVPGLINFEKQPGAAGPATFSCSGITPHRLIAERVRRTPTWQERSQDHVFVTMAWCCYPLSQWYSKSKADFGNSTHSLMRFFLETKLFEPMLQHKFGREAGQIRSSDYVLPAPYVDSGPVVSSSSSDEAARGRAGESRAANRTLDFFFGGQTTTRVGPGRRHMGYYVRWQLMQQWAQRPTDFERTLLVETDKGGEPFNTSMLFRYDHPWPAVRRCDHAPVDVGTRHFSGLDASWKKAPDGTSGVARCVPRCTSDLLGANTGGACYGPYSVAEILPHARFSICARGDIPSSPRLYESIRYGAIPVLVSDAMWRVGLPFQCFVPYELMITSISESDIRRHAGRSLRTLRDSISPTMEHRMRSLTRHFRRDLLWNIPGSRVAENVLLEASRFRLSRADPAGCCPIFDRTDRFYPKATATSSG